MGTLILEGGAEFGGGMREPDLKAIELAGGRSAPSSLFQRLPRRITMTSAPGTMTSAGSGNWEPKMCFRFH